MLVDSHCHLDRLDLTAHEGSLDAALAAAVKALTERYADVDCSVGVHPLDLTADSEPALDWLLSELEHPHAVAIGETGLDYHYEPEAAELQQRSFRLHLDAARICGKPVIVHTRSARADTLELLRQGRELSLADCFALELHLDAQWFAKGDIMEGVRALIIDKDKNPRWNPPTLEEVSPARVTEFFAGFEPGQA